MSRYLVTGAQGFVGRFVVGELLGDEENQVLGVGRSPRLPDHFTHTLQWSNQSIRAPLPSELSEVPFDSERYEYVSADLLDQVTLTQSIRDFRPQRVLHLATGLWGDAPEKLFRCNVEGTVNLINAIGESGVAVDCVVLGSSGGVYGLPRSLPISESATPLPEHMYSVSKLAGEMAGRVAAREHEIPLVTARIFNIVGPGQDERHVCGRWISKLSAIALRQHQTECEQPELQVGTLTTSRDMIDVRDVARATILLSQRGVAGEAYNVGSGIETVMKDILQECLEITNLTDEVAVMSMANRKVDLPRHFADIEKLSALDWQPQVSLSQSLLDLSRYYNERVAPLVCGETHGT